MKDQQVCVLNVFGEIGNEELLLNHQYSSFSFILQKWTAPSSWWCTCCEWDEFLYTIVMSLFHTECDNPVFWSQYQPRLPLSARDLHHGKKTGLSVLSWFTSSSNIRFWLSREKRGWDAWSEQTTLGQSWFASRQTTDFSVLSYFTASPSATKEIEFFKHIVREACQILQVTGRPFTQYLAHLRHDFRNEESTTNLSNSTI